MKSLDQRFLCLEDFSDAARRRLPESVYWFIRAGSEEQKTLHRNADAYDKWQLIPHVLRNVTQVATQTELFGKTWSAPFGIAPMGLLSLSRFNGDCIVAAQAHAHAIPMVMSGSSLIPMETIARANPDIWFQAYLPGAWEAAEKLLGRVLRAGITTLVVTVDLAAAPNPENRIRHGFSIPFRLSGRQIMQVARRPGWLVDVWLRTLLNGGVPRFENVRIERGRSILDPDAGRDFGSGGIMDWDWIERIRSTWPHKLVIKGILHPDDAVKAEHSGVDGIIISNHGGRQLDGAVAPLEVLPEIRKRTGKMTLMIDGGIRRGTDVVKALALGADFVFVGRPLHYAVAAGADRGVDRAIRLLKDEVTRDLALLGLADPREISAGILRAG